MTSLPLALVPIFDVLSQQIEVLPLGVPEQWSEKECQSSVNSGDDESKEDETVTESAYKHTPSNAFCIAWPVFLLGAMAFAIVSHFNH